ncbi:MAG: Nif3-like dinuclear metal center hexameric protein [Hahellaceae bacterium]|nr:Nif3-like dinuclear metal center hexameric protein [Hahellaceae bacterium]MCP5169053.1 Nif3-like dinuclear metal center hexameric protein [Hahellaceae bacterium]
MAVSLSDLVAKADQVMQPGRLADYCPNGLQVEGKPEIARIVSGVTASQDFLEKAIAAKADLVLVHHGYFWKGEDPTLTGIKRRRIKLLMDNEVSLLAYHLPLDVHAEFGNNVQLAKLLNMEVTGPLETGNALSVGLIGQLPAPLSPESLAGLIETRLGRKPLHIPAGNSSIKKVAWCTGAAQGYIEKAIKADVDAYISGEISEPTVHLAREGKVDYFSVGHHASERYGVQALGKFLADYFQIEHCFIDADNPV